VKKREALFNLSFLFDQVSLCRLQVSLHQETVSQMKRGRLRPSAAAAIAFALVADVLGHAEGVRGYKQVSFDKIKKNCYSSSLHFPFP